MVRILHTADMHLDSAMSSLPAIARERRRELLSALSRMVTKADEEEIPVILIAGDLFDNGGAVSSGCLNEVISILSRCRARVFISPGNHDPYAARSAYTLRPWPDNVHIFKSPVPERVRLPELGLSVWGAGFIEDTLTRPLLSGFRVPQDGDIHIMVLHGDPLVPASRYNPISKKDIADSGLDYLALGHVHNHGGILREGNTCYAWPGCPEGRGFDETGDRGIIAGEISRGGANVAFLPFSSRKYEILYTDAENAVPELLSAYSNDIVRLVLTGETSVDTDALHRTLSPYVFYLTIEDMTAPARRDIWERAGEQNLAGIFLSSLKERMESARDEKEKKLAELAASYGLQAMEDGKIEL